MGKVLGGPVIEDFESTEQKPARNPRTGPEVKSGTKAGLKRKHLIRCNQDRPPASRMAREPRTRLDSREPALKPWLNSETGKCKDDSGMSTQANPVPDTRKAEKEIQELCIEPTLPYTGAKFFYLQEARKICLTLHTGANFSIFVKKNWKNSKSHPNGPREGVSPDIDRNGPREGVSPDIDRNGPRKGVRPNDDRNGPREGVSPDIDRNGPREGVRPNDDRNGPREGVSPDIDRNGPCEGVRPNDDRNGPREGVSPDIDRNGPRKGVRPKSC
uniref:Uncharacterized protein n=1 Tax=Fagus sylvatica TaxID=28930 RepID=A0A2N9I0C0_FAGSY